MKLPAVLDKLASLLPCPLYVVGGAVRDFLLGFDGAADIDLASALAPDALAQALEGTDFFVSPVSKKLGTLRVLTTDFCFEYTAFRTDSYDRRGGHSPLAVTFTDDITADAFRRDFSANAIYFDIKSKTYTDPTGGILDIKRRTLRATRPPLEVFSEDALRMLRAVRLAASLGMTLDAETERGIRASAGLLTAVSPPRICDELTKMLVSDTKYGILDAPYAAIRMLSDLGITDVLLPEIAEGRGCKQRSDYHCFDVFEHTAQTVRAAVPTVRLAALFHDIAKPQQLRTTGKMAGHAEAGAELARVRLAALGFSKAVVHETARLVSLHMYDLDCKTSEKKLRLVIQKNRDIIEKLIELKRADALGTGKPRGANESHARLAEVFGKMLAEGVPFFAKDLKVRGADLLCLAPARRSAVQNAILAAAAQGGEMLTRRAQLAFIARCSLNDD